MTEQAPRPVGSVAEETAKLLEALVGEGMARSDASPERPERASATAPSPPGASATAPSSASSGSEPAPGALGADPKTAAGRCEACGQDPATRGASSCQICPVCQLVNAVRAVSPETVDRIADLAAAVTASLRELAKSRWEQADQPEPGRRRSTVEDITVGEEDPASRTEADADPDATPSPGGGPRR